MIRIEIKAEIAEDKYEEALRFCLEIMKVSSDYEGITTGLKSSTHSPAEKKDELHHSSSHLTPAGQPNHKKKDDGL